MSLLYIHEEVEKLKTVLDSMGTKKRELAQSIISKYSDPTKFMPVCSCCSEEHGNDFVNAFRKELKDLAM